MLQVAFLPSFSYVGAQAQLKRLPRFQLLKCSGVDYAVHIQKSGYSLKVVLSEGGMLQLLSVAETPVREQPWREVTAAAA